MRNKRIYTGFKDKNDKRIYVGDIVESLHSGFEYKAVYNARHKEYGLKLLAKNYSSDPFFGFDVFKQSWLEVKEDIIKTKKPTIWYPRFIQGEWEPVEYIDAYSLDNKKWVRNNIFDCMDLCEELNNKKS